MQYCGRWSLAIRLFPLLVGLNLLVACGGGGGGSSGAAGVVEGVVYTGSVARASISDANAEALLAAVFGGNDAANSFSIAAVDGGNGGSDLLPLTGKLAAVSLPAQINRLVRVSLAAASPPLSRPGYVAIAATVIDESAACDTGGQVRQTGRISDQGKGSIVFDFNNCSLEGDLFNGKITLTVNAFDASLGLPLDSRLGFSRLTLSNSQYNISVGGNMTSIIDTAMGSETLTANLVLKDNIGQRTEKIENLVIVNNYAFGLGGSSFTQSISGRFYDPVHGYVDISTFSPMSYLSTADDYPGQGGPVVIEGAGNSRLAMTPVARDRFSLTLDTNGDGAVEFSGTLYWNRLGAPKTAVNNAPSASAGMDFEAGSVAIRLDGSNSNDQDADLISFEWRISREPGGSSVTLQNATTAMPVAELSVPGQYEFRLTVTDARGLSAQDSVLVDAPAAVVSPRFQAVVNVDYLSDSGQMPAVGDINADGLDDIVITTSASSLGAANQSNVLVLLQASTGQLGSPVPYAVGIPPSNYHIRSVDLADVNNDGLTDVVFSHRNSVGVLLQNNQGTLGPVQTVASNHASFSNAYAVRTGDFNADGRQDIASINFGAQSQAVDIYLQNTNGTLASPVSRLSFHAGFDAMASGDINGDGRDDIVVASLQGQNVSVLRQQPDGSFVAAENTQLPAGTGFPEVAIGDVNNDGLNDVLVAVTRTDLPGCPCIYYLPQNIAGTFDTAVIIPVTAVNAITVADMDNDGKNDIVVNQGAYLGLLLQQSDGLFGREDRYFVGGGSSANPDNVATGDINGDGNRDAVVITSGGLKVLYGLVP